MWDFMETLFGILVIIIFVLLAFAFVIAIGIFMTPVLLVILFIIGVIWLVDSIINLIRVCKGKEEKHILNITIEEGEEDNDKRGKDI